MVKTQKFKERKLNSFLHRLAKSVGTSTSGAVDTELNLMVKFTLDKILDSAVTISEEYAKQKSETVKPNLLQAALVASLHGDLKDTATEAGFNAAIAYREAKKAGGIRKQKKFLKAVNVEVTADA